MITRDDLIEIGRLFKPHGYKGEINASFDYDDEFVLSRPALFFDIDGIFVPFFINFVRPKGNDFLLKLDDMESLEDVRPFVNKTVFCMKKDLADFFNVDIDELDEDDDNLIGYLVMDASSGQTIGRVNDIMEGKEYDFLEIADADDEILTIPFIDDFIVEISDSDPDFPDSAGRIVMSLPEGILDLNK